MEPVTSKIGFISVLIIFNACLFSCKKRQADAHVKNTSSSYEQSGYQMKSIGCVINSFAGDSDARSKDLIYNVLTKSNTFKSLKIDDNLSNERSSYALGFGSTVRFKATDDSGQKYSGWISKIPVSGVGGGDEIPSHDGAPTKNSRWTVFQLNNSSGQDVLHMDDWGGFSVQKSCFLLYESGSESDSASKPEN